MWQICLQFFLRFRENLVSLSHRKWNREKVRAQLDVVRSNLQNCGAVREHGESNWSREICFAVFSEIVLICSVQTASPLCCDWVKSLAVCCVRVAAHSLVDAVGFESLLQTLEFHEEQESHAKAVIYWLGRDDRSVFCLNFVPLTTIKSMTFVENCVKTLKISCISCCKNS